MAAPFDGLTPRSRRVLELAGEEAAQLRHGEIGPEHLLLGLLREGPGLATRALAELGVDLAGLGHRVRSSLRPGEVDPGDHIALGQGVRDAIRMARLEAERLHHDHLGTEHLLLGILRGGEGATYLALFGSGVTLERTRRQVASILNDQPPDPALAARGIARSAGRLGGGASSGASRFAFRDPRLDDARHCARCEAPRRPEWRFCAFCGEGWARCGTCDAALPTVVGARFCTECGSGFDLRE